MKERKKAVDKQLIEMAEAKDLTKSKISSVYVKAIAENDGTIQKVINLVLNKNTAVIARLPPPWREKFNFLFCGFERSLLYGPPPRYPQRHAGEYAPGHTFWPRRT